MATTSETNDKLLKQKKCDDLITECLVLFRKQVVELGSYNAETISTVNKIGMAFYAQDKLDFALKLLYRTYYLRKKLLGLKHSDTIFTAKAIANAHLKKGEYAFAFVMYDCLEDGATEQDKIADFHYKEGNFDKALDFYMKILERRMKNTDVDYETIIYYNKKIAESLSKLHRYDEAIDVYLDVSGKLEELFGKAHSRTLDTYRSIAMAYFHLKQYHEAIPMCKKSYKIAKEGLGPKHKDSLLIKGDLAFFLAELGNYDEALDNYLEILSLQTMEDPENPDSLITKKKIARLFRHKELYNSAFLMYNHIYDVLRKTKPKKFKTFDAWSEMAAVRVEEEKFDEALEIYKKICEEMKGVFGNEDPRILDMYHTTGSILLKCRKYDDAVDILNEVFEKRKIVLGNSHVKTISTQQLIAETFARKNDYGKALQTYKEVCQVQRTLPFSTDILASLTNLVSMLCILGKHGEALQVCKEIQNIQEQHPEYINPEDQINDIALTLFKEYGCNKIFESYDELCKRSTYPIKAAIQKTVADLLALQNKFEEAVEGYKRAHRMQCTIEHLGPDHLTTLRTESWIGKMYLVLGKNDEALETLHKVSEKLEATVGPSHKECVHVKLCFSSVLLKIGRLRDGFQIYMDCYEDRKKVINRSNKEILAIEKGIPLFKLYVPKSEMVNAVIYGKLDIVKSIIDRGNSPNIKDIFGCVPMHYASQFGRVDIAKLLLLKGAFYNVRDKTGKLPLNYALDAEMKVLLSRVDRIFLSVLEGDFNYFKKALEIENLCIYAKDSGGNTLLHWAAREKQEAFISTLVGQSAEILVKNIDGKTPIDLAAYDEQIVHFLNHCSQRDINPLCIDIIETEGNTPLHWAVRKGSFSIVKTLLDSGTDPTIANDRGYTPLHMAVYEGHWRIGEALLMHMQKIGNNEMKEFLEAKTYSDGATALHMACKYGREEFLAIFCEYGADIHGTTQTNTVIVHQK